MRGALRLPQRDAPDRRRLLFCRKRQSVAAFIVTVNVLRLRWSFYPSGVGVVASYGTDAGMIVLYDRQRHVRGFVSYHLEFHLFMSRHTQT